MQIKKIVGSEHGLKRQKSGFEVIYNVCVIVEIKKKQPWWDADIKNS